MSHCYLIGWIDLQSRALVRVSLASAYPVSQIAHREHQALLHERVGASYQEAEDAMRVELRGPWLSWTRDLIVGGHGG